MSSSLVVVDTNVAIAANGRNTHADLSCQLACIKCLDDVAKNKTVFIDINEQIFNEYKRYLNFPGEPGVGDAFFKHVFNHQYSNNKVKRVQINLSNDPSRGFEELPQNTLDASDRKFLAVAVVAKAKIINATDSDWIENLKLLEIVSVKLQNLCPHHLKTLST